MKRILKILFFISYIIEASSKFEIPQDYVKDSLPISNEGKKGVVNVKFNIYVEAINPIKAADMDFRMKLYIFQSWEDKRLNFSEDQFGNNEHILLPQELTEQIWHPDPFIVNAKNTEVGQLVQKQVSVYIYRNQTVASSTNLFATVACAMQFQYYPYDTQTCPMIIESYSYDLTKVFYEWAPTNAFVINPQLRLLQFEVHRPLYVKQETFDRLKEERKFSRLIAFFRFDRLLGNHLIQVFAPCSLVISLSWFSFWLDMDAIPARVSVIVTSMLTLVTQFNGLKLDLPPVAYVKAVDIWMAGCMIFIFGALGEFVIVKVVSNITEDKIKDFEDKQKALAAAEKETMSPNIDLGDKFSLDEPRNKSEELEGMTRKPFKLSRFIVLEDLVIKSPSSGAYPKRGSVFDRERTKEDNEEINRKISKLKVEISASFLNTKIPLVWVQSKKNKRKVLWKEIDSISRWAFPTTFCFFSLIYWLVLWIHRNFMLPSGPYNTNIK